jgi:hypothetical protein
VLPCWARVEPGEAMGEEEGGGGGGQKWSHADRLQIC